MVLGSDLSACELQYKTEGSRVHVVKWLSCFVGQTYFSLRQWLGQQNVAIAHFVIEAMLGKERKKEKARVVKRKIVQICANV